MPTTFAEQSQNKIPTLKDSKESTSQSLIITGSRLRPIDNESISPITIINREAILTSGVTKIADLLRGLSSNTHGSRKETPGGIAQGQATMNIRGLGEQRTLILINGHRIANSAAIPDAQNINLIPLAAVERIEILKDGASSIYGSDAVGGVVNIILRKNVTSHEVAVQRALPSAHNGKEQLFTFSGGVTNSWYSLTYAGEFFTSGEVSARDLELTKVGLSRFGFPATYTVHAIDPQTGYNLQTNIADSRCPQTLQTSEEFPNSIEQAGFCQYNFANNTSLYPKMQRSSLMLDTNGQLDTQLQFSAHLNYSINDSQGHYAPPPSVGSLPYLPYISADNSNNPTAGQEIAFDSDFDGVDDVFLSGPFDLSIHYRNLANGLRQTDAKDEMLNFLVGMDGDFAHASSFIWTLFYNSNQSNSYQTGLVKRDLLQAAINNESFDIFAVNTATDVTLAESFTLATQFHSKFEITGTRLSFSSNLFNQGEKNETKQQPQDSAFGLELIQQKYFSDYADDFSSKHIDGRAGGGDAKGRRDILSAFYESNHPLGKKLNFNLSMRLDHYNDFGNRFNPKVGFTYRVNPSLLLRSSIGTGFRAPSLFELNSQASQSFGYNIDLYLCDAIGDTDNNGVLDSEQNINQLPLGHPCRPTEFAVISSGNKNLQAEKSRSMTFGAVFQPSPQFSLKLNFFHQEFSEQIRRIPVYDILRRELDFGDSLGITRDEFGRVRSIIVSYDNFSGIKTRGFDLESYYDFYAGSLGHLTAYIDLTSVLGFKIETNKGEGFIEHRGRYGYAKGKVGYGLSWTRKDLSARLGFGYTPTIKDQAIVIPAATSTGIHFNWKNLFGGELYFAIENLTGIEPTSNPALGWPYFDGDNTSIAGRRFIVRYQTSL